MERGVEARGPGFRLYATPANAPRARRATDVLLAAAALLGLVLLGWVTQPPASVESALIDLLAALPGFLSAAWQLLYDLLIPWALALLVVALVRGRFTLARDQTLAAVAAVVVGVVAGNVVDASWAGMWDVLTADEPPAQFPPLRIATAAACVATASPYLSHPVRKVSGWIVALGTVSAALVGVATPTGALAGLLAGTLAAAAVHLVFGSCGGRPGLGEVREALADLDVAVSSLDATARQPAGAFLVAGLGHDGRRLTVKVYGRDAYDAQLLTRLWRAVWYRGDGVAPTLSRLQQAEHEAFLTLLARQGGAPVQEVITAGVTDEDDALLVMELRGTPLGDLPAGEVTDDVLRDLWRAVGLLHRNAIAHGQIDPLTVRVDGGPADGDPADGGPAGNDPADAGRAGGGRVTLVDLSGAAVAPDDDQRRTDEAQTLVTSVVAAGADRALARAHAALGAGGLARVVPYLQMPALSRGLRLQVRRAGIDLDDLRRRAAEIAGTPPADLQQLRRVTLATVLQTAVLVLAFTALISGVGELDLEDIATQMGDANWWWAGFGALLAQSPRLAQAVSTLGASPRPLPLGPVYALQLAISYINLAVPSAAARVAVNVRFFQRRGVSSTSALAVGAIDGFTGFVVEILLLGSLLVFSNVSLDLHLDAPTSGGAARLLLVVLVVAAPAVGVVLAVGPWRRAIVDKVLEMAREAWGVLRGLRSAPRLAKLLGGNLASELLFACALAAFVRAFGYDVGLGDLLVINLSTSLLAGVMPVPGGIGVTEGALTVGLVAAGLPDETAFAVAITYRLASFYLPPIWGYFSFRWLQRNEYL